MLVLAGWFVAGNHLGILAADSRLAGDWTGTLDINGVQLRIVFHISKKSGGGLAATMDSPDQGGRGIPAAVEETKPPAVRLAVASVQGAFEGKMDQTGSKMTGHWSQGPASLPLVLEKFDASKGDPKDARKANPESIAVNKKTNGKLVGQWQGTLEAGVSLRLVFKIVQSSEGGLLGTIDSLDQGATDIPMTAIKSDGDKIRFECKTIGGVFQAALDKTASEISGSWEQGGNTLPLVIRKQSK